MKRVIALLLCLVLAVGVLAACGEPEEVHTHTYSETWSSDAEGHWYEPTCDCDDATIRKYSHADANNDGACDVCTFTNHTHTYSEEWTVDCTNHWHAADCGHIVAGADVAAHVDENGDGECDVCNYVIEDIHNHYYSTEWSYDETNHWHAALCEHSVEVADQAAHNVDAAGYCTVCEAKVVEIDTTDLAAILAAAVARNDKVAYGDVIATESVYGGTGAETLENGKTNKVHFALGNGESYIQYISFDMNGTYVGQEEQWFEDLGNGEVFGAAMLNGDYELSPIAGAAQFLNGYNYIPGSIIPSDSADTSTLANMLSALYAQMKAGVNVSNATESTEGGKYTFAYTYYSVNAQTASGVVFNVEIEYYNVDVEFTVNDDLIIDSATFQVEVYRDYEADSDLSYTYVDNGDGTVTISDLALKATANPSFYDYTVAQMSGERTFTTPYPRASLLPSSFNLLYVIETTEDANGNPIPSVTEPIGDVIEIQTKTYAKFAIGDILPLTASSKFLNSDDFIFSFVNNDPDSDGRAWYMDQGSTDAMLNGYTAYNGMLKLMLRDVGEYTVTLGFGDVTTTFTLKITAEPEVILPEDTETTINVETTDTYGWLDEYTYTATESGTYTFTIPVGLGIWLETSAQPEIDYYSANGGTVSFQLAAGKSINYTIASTTKGAWQIEVAFVAGEVEGGDEGGDDVTGTVGDIVGTYYSGDNVLVINDDGTMTFTYGSSVLKYTYRIDGDTVYYSLNGNPEYTSTGSMAAFFGYLTFDAEGKPATFEYNDSSFALSTTQGGDVGGDEGGDEGDGFEGEGTVDSPYVIPELGDYTVAFPGGYSPIWFVYTATGDGYVTVSTTFASGWLMIGEDDYSASNNSNGGNGSSISLLVKAGKTVYIGVGDWDEQAVDVPFTVSFESVQFGSVEPFVGNWTGTESAWGSTATYDITINADGTGIGAYDMGSGVTYFDITAIMVIGDTVIMDTVTTGDYGGTTATLTLTWSEAEATLTTDMGLMWGALTLVPGGNGPSTDNTGSEKELVIGNNEISGSNVTYTYTATEEGTLELTVGAAIMGPVDMTYSINGGDAVTLTLGEITNVSLYIGDVIVITVVSEGGYSSITAAWTVGGGDVGGGDTPVAGTVELTVPGQYAYSPVVSYTVPADGTYVISADLGSTGAWLYCAGTAIQSKLPYTVEFTAGEVVEFKLFCMSNAGDMIGETIVITITPETAGGDEGGDEGGEGMTGSGTKNDPYVITELPYDIKYTGAHDYYYSYTATKDVILTITCPAGCYVSETGAIKDDNGNYVINLTAGEKLSINTWTTATAATEYVYSVTCVDKPEDSGDVGGDVGDLSGTTYLATNSNGRKMMVVVYSDGTMTVTRSDMTGNFTGGATTANYTWEMVDGVFTFTKVGNNSVTAMSFTEDGTPISVTWAGAVYEGFTLQA